MTTFTFIIIWYLTGLVTVFMITLVERQQGFTITYRDWVESFGWAVLGFLLPLCVLITIILQKTGRVRWLLVVHDRLVGWLEKP